MERLWRHVQCSIPAEVIILRIAAGLIPMPQPPSFNDKESDYEDLRDEMQSTRGAMVSAHSTSKASKSF